MFKQSKRLVVMVVLVLSVFLLQMFPTFKGTAAELTDWQWISLANAELKKVGTLYPQENTDQNVVPMVQELVDEFAPGVTVTFYESRHSQISATGDITYGSKTVSNNVVFMLKKNDAYNKQLLKVVVPAHIELVNEPKEPVEEPAEEPAEEPTTEPVVQLTDWQWISLANTRLKEISTLNPQENVDTNVVPMVQKLVDGFAPGVTVSFYESRHSQISSSGDITYGTTMVSNNVVFMLKKNSAYNKQLMKVIVPARTTTETPVEPEPVEPGPVEPEPVEPEPIVNQDQTAPVGLAATAPTSAANNDGTITGVTAAMEYKAVSASAYTPVTGTVITGLAAGNYLVRYAAREGYNAGADAYVTVPAYIIPVSSVINVKDFGAKGDGVTDDASAIQNAAYAARNNKAELYMPAGDYYLGKNIYIYTSLTSEGKFVVRNSASTPVITFASAVSGVNIPASSLSGLNRDSGKITGLNGYEGGTVVLKSTEELIKRFQGTTQNESYTKNDVSRITSASGSIYPALDCTYTDKSKLTVTVYPREEPITVKGLYVETIGDTPNYKYSVWVKRSNVTFDGIDLINVSSAGAPEGGMYLVDCTDVTINDPIISGYAGSGDKYGICLGVTANITIDGGSISKSRHGITGRHSKNVVIRNGSFTGTVAAVDNHWGNDFLVENCIIDGNAGVSYSGTDITIRNCQFLNCINIFTLRNDTPEIMGKVLVENVTAKSPSNYNTMYCYRATYEGYVRDWGRDLEEPDVTFNGVRAELASTGTLYHKDILSAYAAEYTGKLHFSDIVTVNGSRIVP